MGNTASVPALDAAHESSFADEKPRIKKSSLPSLPTSSHAVSHHAAWRRASEPAILPRKKSFLSKSSRRRSDEDRPKPDDEEDSGRPEMPRIVIGGGQAGGSIPDDPCEGLMVRVAGRKFSRADPVDTEDALDALERITRAASFSVTATTETGLGLMTKAKSQQGRPAAVPFSFDVNYRLDSPRTANTYSPDPSFPPSFSAQAQTDISPFDSPTPRLPLSPQSHWSESSACGLTPPQTFQSFRNSVNLSKTINRYSNLFIPTGDSTPSPPDSIADAHGQRPSARTKLGGMWKGHRGKKGPGQGKELRDIVVVRAERVGSSRYSEMRAAAGRTSEARFSTASSSFPTSPDLDGTATRSASSSSSRIDRASWMQIDPTKAPAQRTPSPSRRHSSPDPQLATLVAASPNLAFADPEDIIFVPFESETPRPANSAPVKVSTRLPSGHPAAYHLGRFSTHHQSPPPPTRRPPLADSRTSSYHSGQRLSAYTAGSRQSVISEVDSTSSALQATVQQVYRRSRIDSIADPLPDAVPSEPLPLHFPLPQPQESPVLAREIPRRVSISSAGWSARRPSQASALSFPRSDSPDCPRTGAGRHLSITSTFFGESSSSPEASPPPVPLPRSDFDFAGYSLEPSNANRPTVRKEVAPEIDPGKVAVGLVRRSRPPSLELDRARCSTPSSVPALTSATSTSFSSRSSMDPCPTLHVPPTRPFGRLSLEQPDAALFSPSKPLPLAPAQHPSTTIDFGNFSLDPWNHRLPRVSGPSRKPGLDEYSWNRASAGDALAPYHSRRPSSSSVVVVVPSSLGLDDRRETYPGMRPSQPSSFSNQPRRPRDPLVERTVERDYPERKRGMSKDEVRIWLAGERSVPL